jgi:hypothetical protein
MWCTIPGLEGVESPYLPTAFMSTAIIGFYYLCWAWHTGRPSTSTLLAFGIVWIAQFGTFIFGECSMSYRALFGSVLFNIILSTVAGIIIGAISFASAQGNARLNPYNLPSGLPNASTGGSTLKNVGHSQPVQAGGDENTFVAELYKNGQLVTDSIAK